MGYASTILYGDNVEIGGSIYTILTLVNVGADYTINDITIPSDMLHRLKAVYLDLIVQYTQNDSGQPQNYLEQDCHVGLHDGALFREGLTLAQNGLWTLGAIPNPGMRFYGNTNIVDSFASSATASVRMNSGQAHFNNLNLYGILPIVRCVVSS